MDWGLSEPPRPKDLATRRAGKRDNKSHIVGVEVDLSTSAGRVVNFVAWTDAGQGVNVACAVAAGRFLRFGACQTGTAERGAHMNASRARETELLRASTSSIVDMAGGEGGRESVRKQ